MPCSRQSALTGAPASACFNIASIWLSLYLDFFMQNLLHIVYEKILLMNSVIIRGDYPPSSVAAWSLTTSCQWPSKTPALRHQWPVQAVFASLGCPAAPAPQSNWLLTEL